MRIQQIKTILSLSTDGTVAFLHSSPLKECVVVLVVEEGAKQAMMTCHQIMCLKLKFICIFFTTFVTTNVSSILQSEKLDRNILWQAVGNYHLSHA